MFKTIIFKICYVSIGITLVINLQSCDLEGGGPLNKAETKIANTKNFDEIKPYLKTDNLNDFIFAIWYMASFSDYKAFDFLVSLWEGGTSSSIKLNREITDNTEVKLVTAASLIRAGYYHSQDCTEYILKSLSDEDYNNRQRAIEVLSSLGEDLSVEILSTIASESEDDRTRITAIRGLRMLALGFEKNATPNIAKLTRTILSSLEEKLLSSSPAVQRQYKEIMEEVDDQKIKIAEQYEKCKKLYPSMKVYPLSYVLLKPYADRGYPYAKYVVGNMYLYGKAGAEQNVEKGVEELESVGSEGFPAAYFALFKAYSTGDILKQNNNLAIQYLKTSAQNQYIDAQAELGMIYGSGSHGVERSMEKNNFWISKSINNSNRCTFSLRM